MRGQWSWLVACAVAVAACGGDDDAGSATAGVATAAPGDSVAPAPASTTAGSAAPEPQPAGTTLPTDAAAAPAGGRGVLRVIGTNAPQHVDPVRGISRCDPPQLAPLYDQLVRVEPDGTLVPGVAASWASPDPLTFDITLHEGVMFSDGTPYDAAAVAAHLERAQRDPESTLVGSTGFIESTEVLDDLTLRLHLSEPRAGILPGLFADRLGMVPSPAAVEAAGTAYGTEGGVGAGPYVFDSLTPNENMHLSAWDGYWQPETQLLDGIEFAGAATEFQAERIRSGEIDYASVKDVDYPIIREAAASGDIEYQLTPSEQYTHIFVNWAKPPFDDIRVRQALEHALDRELLAEVLSDGAGTPAWGPLTTTSWAHNPDVEEMYPYDTTKAKELLTAAGYPDGITLQVATIDNPYYQRLAVAVQDMLLESGITLEFATVTGAEIQNSLYVRKEHDAAITAWIGAADPGIGLEQRWSSTGSNNPAGTTAEGLDELLAEGAATVDQDARAAAYQEAELLIMEQALEIPIYFNGGLVAYRPNVENVVRGYTTCATGNFLTPPPYFSASDD